MNLIFTSTFLPSTIWSSCLDFSGVEHVIVFDINTKNYTYQTGTYSPHFIREEVIDL